MRVETGYANLGGDRIAFQLVGEGPLDLVVTAGSYGSFDVEWEMPQVRQFFERLASFSRVIRFDRRGSGGSDPLPLDALPPWESFVEEVDAVMAAAGSERAALFAALDAGTMAMLFAATRPERTVAVILAQTTARFLASDDYPIGVPPEVAEHLIAAADQVWGTEEQAAQQVPSQAHDPSFRQWYARLTRSIASPAAAVAYFRAVLATDARSLLSEIRVPTLVLHRAAYPFVPVEHGRYLAQHIAGAKLVELPGADGPLIWEHPELTLDAIEEFLTGVRRGPHADRVVAAVASSQALDSEGAAALEELGRSILSTDGGHLMSTEGAVLATFDGPGRAIRTMIELHQALAGRGVTIRTGIHVGEVEVEGDMRGLALDVSRGVMDLAGPAEILVTRTVQDLVVGSVFVFEERGAYRSDESEWQVLSVVM